MFWIICAVLTAVVAAMVVAPMLRPPEDDGADPQVALYKAQLAEVDRDVARDVIAPEDAERAKAEIARRLLAASKQDAAATASNPMTKPVVGALIAGIVAIAGGTYWQLGVPDYPDLPLAKRIAMSEEVRANRPTQAQAEAAAPPVPAPEVPEDYLEAVTQLREMLPERGDDLRGWELLAYHEAQLGNFADAAAAQARVIAIKGTEASEADKIRQVDMLVAAANGFISPEAEVLVRDVLDENPNNTAGRYYLGAMFNQTDRPDLAFRYWRSILESGAPESMHLELARGQIAGAAFRAGTDYTPPQPSLSGPSMEQMMAAEDMDPEARNEMIAGMVASLSDRLATQGGSVEEWARLIVAQSVLGDTDQAKEILAEAREVFGASDAATAVLDEAATRAGLVQ